ncbi:response regulator [bacterium]|nr:response regulator [bacterium]
MSKRNILLADNSMDVKEVFQAVFNNDDYRLQITNSPSETLAEVFTNAPDIVVLDGDTEKHSNHEIVKTMRANSSTSRIPTLVILHDNDPEAKIIFNNAGSCDFLIKPLTPDRIRVEVDALIKGRNLFGSQMSTKIITFCGVRGGSGTTTLAINSALSFVESDKSVILLETSNYFSGIKPGLNLTTRKTLPFMMIEDLDSITSENVQKFIETLPSGLKTIPTVAGIADMEKMNADAVHFIRTNVCPVANYAVIDAGYGLSEATLELFEISDAIVFVATLDLPSLYNLDLISQVFSGTRININKCSVVFNHVHHAGEIAEKTVRDLKAKMPVLGFIPNHAVGFLKAINTGEPYISLFPKSSSAKAIRKISDKIFSSLQNDEIRTEVA